MVGQIAMETGWSLNRILDTNVVMLNLMMADAPHYVPERKRSMADMIREMEERERLRNQPPQPEEPNKGVDPISYFSQMDVQD